MLNIVRSIRIDEPRGRLERFVVLKEPKIIDSRCFIINFFLASIDASISNILASDLEATK
jgi:hypothetical protein